jgi:hypothetical protein
MKALRFAYMDVAVRRSGKGREAYVHGWTVLEQRRSSCRGCGKLYRPTQLNL